MDLIPLAPFKKDGNRIENFFKTEEILGKVYPL
jgi:hypothetical protein